MRTGRSYAPDRGAPPPPGEAREFRFPGYLRHRLASGLTVLAARHPRAPLVSLELIFPAGAQQAPAERAGLAPLTGTLLDEGTPERSALEIAATIERLGGQLSTSADWDHAWVSAELESRHAAAGLALIAEVATAPSFPEAEVARLRRLRLAEVLRQRADPTSLAQDRFARAVYGDSAYGFPLLGTENSLAALDRAAVEAFYRRHYGLAGAFAVAVGDLDPERLIAEVEARLGRGDDRPPPPAAPEIRPLPRAGVEVHLVDRPGSAQTELLVGHAGVPRPHQDFLALQVMNSLLGGKFTSRINLNLRERHGFTYGAQSRFSTRLGPGPFQLSASVATPVAGAAAAELLAELARIREEPVGAGELADTQSYLIGVFPYSLQTVSGLAHRLESLAVFDLAPDYYDRLPEAVRAVDAERILEVARRHLHPDRLVVVAVGAAAELAPQLAALGRVEVWPAERVEAG